MSGNAKRRTIELFRTGGFYAARYDDPAVVEAFGQDTIPTAFTSEADPVEVLAYVSEKNPECEVFLVPTSAVRLPSVKGRN